MRELRYFLKQLSPVFYVLPLLWVACREQHSTARDISHMAIASRARETFYIDRIDNAVIMKTEPGDASKTSFCSFRIGWQDSLLQTDQEQSIKKEKYFQYDMQKDWIALVKGDSLYPVFFQEEPGLDRQLKKGVMVFEVPAGQVPDTIIYRDSYGAWGTQLFVLNRKKL